MASQNQRDTWVMLCYRLPREPSTPRVLLWRKLGKLGVAQLVDGLVALPADARTREQLEWLGETVRENGGEATVWLARPTSSGQEESLRSAMASSIATEYRKVVDEATDSRGADPVTQRRVVARLRRELYRIGQRDYFPPPERDTARAAVEALCQQVEWTDLPGEAARR